MSNYDLMITVASWEPRFLLGFEDRIEKHLPKKVMMFYYADYAELSKENRLKAKKKCRDMKVKMSEIEIHFGSPKNSWFTFKEVLGKERLKSKKVIIDITTMPRDSIFALLLFLDYYEAKTDYVYSKPHEYSKKWLSRNPDKPRLVFKHSGVFTPGKKSVLIIITGFDAERTDQLINYFEPAITLIGYQKGVQFENLKQNVAKHKKYYDQWKVQTELKTFTLDAYEKSHGYEVLDRKIKKYIKDSNIIISSLGPKPSAIALYKLNKQYPEIAIAYTPSKEFNPLYSNGIKKGAPIKGKM